MKTAIKIIAANPLKTRNPVAASLRLGQFKTKIVADRTKYRRTRLKDLES